MNEELYDRLKSVRNGLCKPYVEEFTSPNGRTGYRCYNSMMGEFEIHICETREDIEASNRNHW